jgi:hypothetical protein
MFTILRTLAATGILASVAFPLSARAAATTSADPQHYRLETVITQRYHAGEIDGTLTMTIYPSGIVQGQYRADDGNVRNVTGGLDGERIWLDIGSNGNFRLSGTFKNGVLETVAQIPGSDTTTFDSVQPPVK